MTIVLGIVTCLTCVLLVPCSATHLTHLTSPHNTPLHSFTHCARSDLRVNCTSVKLSHVPIIFNPRLTELTLRDMDITQLGMSRPLEVYTRVEYLDLSQNGLAHIPDGAFGKQKVLRVSFLKLANCLNMRFPAVDHHIGLLAYFSCHSFACDL